MKPDKPPPFGLVGLDHIVLKVTDMDTAITFYRDVLGASIEREIESLGMVQMRTGASLIDLVPQKEIVSVQNMEHFALTIDPFDEVSISSHLEAHGIKSEPAARRYGAGGFGPSIYINDPDGNMVELKGPAEPGTKLQG